MCGAVWPVSNGSSVGPSGTQPPASCETGLPPSHGTPTLALRPACAIWMPGTAPIRLITAASRASSA